MNLRTATLISLLLMFLLGLYSLWVYPALPDLVPVHWNLRGEIDGWMPKGTAVFFMPGVMGFLLALMLGAPRLSPRHFGVESSRYTFNYIMVLVIALMAYLGVVMFQAALHPDLNSDRYLMGGIMLFFTLMSNSLGKVRRNFWMGVRTPWTLASERVWIATHRLAARLWFVTGLILTPAILLGAPTTPVFVIFMIALFVPVFYSFWFYKHIQTFGPGPLLILLLVGGLVLPGCRTGAEGKALETSALADISRELRFQGEGGFELQRTSRAAQRQLRPQRGQIGGRPGL